MLPSDCMAHRLEPKELDRPLTAEELKNYGKRLSALPPHEVADLYRQAHEHCRIEGDKTPRARSIQELVTRGS